ncbi:MAG: class I SAM-dependent methyltransferase [Ignavibacteriales bacterium]|nr:class I SAM-dependent methyltransferase [Ignavibacteriales bacterium]
MSQKFDYITHYKIDAKEFDYFEERTGATEHDERRVHEFITSKIPNKIENILDVGCGSAWVAAKFSDKINVTSLDLSLENVTKAKLSYPNLKHTQIIADSLLLPFADNSFDVVVASEIIEHIYYPEEFVNELFRVVKQNGKLIITTPYKEKLRYYLCIHCNKKTPVHAHIHSFDEKILLNFCTSANLKEIKWTTFGNKFLIFLRTYIILKYLPFPMWKFIDAFFNKLKNLPVHIIVEYKKK